MDITNLAFIDSKENRNNSIKKYTLKIQQTKLSHTGYQ